MPRGFRHVSLLVSLLLLTVLSTVFGGERRFLGISIRDLCSCAILLAAVFSIGRRRRTRVVAVGLAVPMLIMIALSNIFENPAIDVVERLSVLLFLVFVACVVLEDVLGAGQVTTDRIVGAICVYFLIGVIWALFYDLTEQLAPGSFDFARLEEGLVANRATFSGLIYYSFVTLSTLGYGDIVPLGPMARTLSWMEALTGQLYIAVLVARLVALHITQTHGTGARGRACDDGQPGGPAT